MGKFLATLPLVAIALFGQSIFCLPGPSSNLNHAERDINLVPMTWVGPVTEGGANVTLSGSAEVSHSHTLQNHCILTDKSRTSTPRSSNSTLITNPISTLETSPYQLSQASTSVIGLRTGLRFVISSNLFASRLFRMGSPICGP